MSKWPEIKITGSLDSFISTNIFWPSILKNFSFADCLNRLIKIYSDKFGYVGPIPLIFQDTIKNNILYGVDVDIEDEVEVDADVEVEDDVNIDAEGDDINIKKRSVKADIEVGLSPEEELVQDSLEAAMKASEALGNNTLTDQIGNTITYFTREFVVGNRTD